MTEENDGFKKYFWELIIILVLVGIIIVVAMQFMAPTIGNVFEGCTGTLEGV